MTLTAWSLTALIILPTTYLLWSFVSVDRRSALLIQSNLGRDTTAASDRTSSRPPIFLGMAHKITPRSYVGKLDRLLAMAGRPISMPLERILIAKPALALAGAVLGILLVARNLSTGTILLAVVIMVLGYFLPDLLVYNNGIKRQQLIEQELPNTLDQMLISVEAGLGFETAMARAGQSGKGPLAEELVRTLHDIQVGRSRLEAYQAMAERSTVQDLKSFVRAVVQADKYGIGIAKVLRIQAKQARIKRRQRAEEKAMKLPVKVLFPLLFCIFPVLFIVLLGPAAINIMNTFMRI
ncbi:type II secretion system F family protein [Arthrobacter sp. I2-34]|uniref:Type II secretion system F family protein n=1 Tax=Arthrobacter hankyongi TaxID=2904801 RepID=A0ABS9L4M4_9MICC|nr:type II secretion system F family protein [Arthrobacter hankyongi]MCG2621609.1 type II secretion system F family protein [Arthrobacter hankyongi]